MEALFMYIGIASSIVIGGMLAILGVEKFSNWFKEWRKYKCKFKCLCKHTYEIQYIANDERMHIKCKTCGKYKKIYFDKNSLNAFRFKK